jgi:hypothetical protein
LFAGRLFGDHEVLRRPLDALHPHAVLLAQRSERWLEKYRGHLEVLPNLLAS